MAYMIDGHNLIGKLPDIDLDDPNDEAMLVQKLSAFAARTRKRCLVIFDKGLPGGKSRMSNQNVTVFFAPHDANADRVMINRISGIQNPKDWTIVSSDNAVLAAAKRRKISTLKSAEFASLMERPEPPEKLGVDESPDVRLSPKEVEEWLSLFNEKKR